MSGIISNGIKDFIKEEYHNLCRTANINSKPLDIYLIDGLSSEITALGTPVKNATPGYTGQIILLPQEPQETDSNNFKHLKFPPTNYDKYSYEWPVWRIELWHEVCHQIEDEIFQVWKPGNDNPATFRNAGAYLADKLNVDYNALLKGL